MVVVVATVVVVTTVVAIVVGLTVVNVFGKLILIYLSSRSLVFLVTKFCSS